MSGDAGGGFGSRGGLGMVVDDWVDGGSGGVWGRRVGSCEAWGSLDW